MIDQWSNAVLALSQVEVAEPSTRMLGTSGDCWCGGKSGALIGRCWGLNLLILGHAQEVLTYRAGPSGAGRWQMSSHGYSDQPRPRARCVSVWITP